jgi:hypothetical protein
VVAGNSIICLPRVKLAVHRETHECVAVKIVNVDGSSGLTRENLRKEVLTVCHDTDTVTWKFRGGLTQNIDCKQSFCTGWQS